MEYYTYVYLDPRKPGKWHTSYATFLFEPFYVGEGKNRRMFAHLTDKKPSYKTHKIQKLIQLGLHPIIIKLHTDLSITDSVDREFELIREIGTIKPIPDIPRGPLTNQQTGRSSKKPMADTTKQKISISGKGKNAGKSSPNKGKPSPLRGIPRSPEVVKKIRQGISNRTPWAHTWQIEFEDGSPSIQIANLAAWCKPQGIVPLSADHAGRRHAWHKGVRATKLSTHPVTQNPGTSEEGTDPSIILS